MNAFPDPEIISRLVDDAQSDDAWNEFETLAGAESSWWRELASAQRDQAVLRAALVEAGRVADGVDLPLPVAGRLRAVSAWSGWAVAALILLGVTIWATLPAPTSGPDQSPAAALAELSPADTLREYLRKGRERGSVIGEMPSKMLVDVLPDPSGEGYQVIYFRPILERTQARDLYELAGQDESGNPAFVRYTPPPARSPY